MTADEAVTALEEAIDAGNKVAAFEAVGELMNQAQADASLAAASTAIDSNLSKLDEIEKLGMLAAKAIQLNAFAASDLMESNPTKAHLLYRKSTAAHMAELREAMGADWVERECGWPDLNAKPEGTDPT